MWYVFDALEIIMGPYETKEQAESDMKLHTDELYLLDNYENPYTDYIEENICESLIRLQDRYNRQTKLSKDRKEMRRQIEGVLRRIN